ncbi:hypothetical protein WJT74_04260 [Sphingomicrobium sp. XHP0239]|uniref:hypothetical protein n=1 Tax=Sphingomicrobium maritimum TaxID=3133972 RepID=UPI0031CC9709
MNTLDQTNASSSRFSTVRQKSGEFVDSSVQTIKDNPKTSAAIGAGVAVAAGAGAFLLNRKAKTGTAFGTARGIDGDVLDKVDEINREPKA